MDHKAYPFNFNAYSLQLHHILVSALASGELRDLTQFVEREKESLSNPYEGDPLPADWRETFKIAKLQYCGQLALTKYFNASEEIGLGHEWEDAIAALNSAGYDGEGIVLGDVVQGGDVVFDPNRLGSYFQTPEKVVDGWHAVRAVMESDPGSSMEWLLRMFEVPKAKGFGLYVTF
jgi:hypothetical protein